MMTSNGETLELRNSYFASLFTKGNPFLAHGRGEGTARSQSTEEGPEDGRGIKAPDFKKL